MNYLNRACLFFFCFGGEFAPFQVKTVDSRVTAVAYPGYTRKILFGKAHLTGEYFKHVFSIQPRSRLKYQTKISRKPGLIMKPRLFARPDFFF